MDPKIIDMVRVYLWFYPLASKRSIGLVNGYFHNVNLENTEHDILFDDANSVLEVLLKDNNLKDFLKEKITKCVVHEATKKNCAINWARENRIYIEFFSNSDETRSDTYRRLNALIQEIKKPTN